jgi:hypothetical protein
VHTRWHEASHAVVARILGIPVEEVTATIFGRQRPNQAAAFVVGVGGRLFTLLKYDPALCAAGMFAVLITNAELVPI